jgi:hypothetical protein
MYRADCGAVTMSYAEKQRRKATKARGMAAAPGCTGKTATCQCENHWGVSRVKVYGDDAKRFAAEVNMHITAGGFDVVGQTLAIRLSDGGCDHSIYPDPDTAAKHQSDSDLCFYFQIPPDGLSEREAAIGLQWNRAMYDAGLRWRSMDGNQMIMPLANEDIAQQLQALRQMAGGYN